MNNHWLKIAIVVSVITALVTAVLYSRADDTSELTDDRLSVSVQKVQSQSNYSVTRFFPALAEAQQSVQLGSEIAGKVTNIYVDDGDSVAAGDPLFELDTQLLKTQKDALIAQVNSIKPEMSLVKKRLKRQRDLKQQSFSSEDNIDALEAQLSVLSASINNITAQINDIDTRIRKSSVSAPFDASVQMRLLDEGAVINAGTPVLHLVGNKVLEISTGLPAELVSQLNSSDTYTALLNDKSIPVKLTRVLPEINPITRTQGVKFSLDSAEDLTPSDYLKLSFTSRFEKTGFWLPNTALVEGPRGLWEIFTITDDNRVKKYSVSVVYASNPSSYVTSAIADGSNVVVEGVHRLAQGVRVNVTDYR